MSVESCRCGWCGDGCGVFKGGPDPSTREPYSTTPYPQAPHRLPHRFDGRETHQLFCRMLVVSDWIWLRTSLCSPKSFVILAVA